MATEKKIEVKTVQEANLSIQDQIMACIHVAIHDVAKDFDALPTFGRSEEAEFEVIRRNCPLVTKAFKQKVAKERLFQKNIALQEVQEIIDQVFAINKKKEGS